MLEKLAAEGRIFMSTHRAMEVLRSGVPLADLSPPADDPRAPPDRIGCGMLNPNAPNE
jgi:hypothetical protein